MLCGFIDCTLCVNLHRQYMQIKITYHCWRKMIECYELMSPILETDWSYKF